MTDASLQLFDGCRAELDDSKAVLAPRIEMAELETVYSVCGFSGKDMRGSILLGLQKRLLVASYPTKGPATAEELRQWAGELANQLLGRFKNKLLARGLVVDVSIPMTMCGRGVHFGAARAQTMVIEHSFNYTGEPFVVRLEARCGEGVELQPEREVAAEGEMMLF